MSRIWPVFLLVFALGNGLAQTADCQDRLWRPYFELEGRGGARELGQGSLFVPLWQDCQNLLFADLRGLWTDVHSAEGNWGLAFRRMDGDWITGAYAFYDVLHSPHNNNFNQMAFGAELMSANWGLRANGYIPESDLKYAGTTHGASLQDGNLVLHSDAEAAYWGLDVEVERLLGWTQTDPDVRPSFRNLESLDAEIWGAIGLFHFQTDVSGCDALTGPRARAELRLHDLALAGADSRLVLSAQYEYDEVRGSSGTGSLSVRIPFGSGGGRSGRRLSPLERRMVNPIVRDIDVVTHAAILDEPAMVAATGGQINSAVSVDANGDLVAAVSAAGSNSLVMVDGSAGLFVTNNTAYLSDGQAVVGGGSQLAVIGVNSGAETLFTVPGVRPTIDGPPGSQDVFWVANNSAIQGFNIINCRNGMSGHNVSGFLIADNHVDTTVTGIYLGGTVNGDIIDNTAIASIAILANTFTGGTISGNTASGGRNGVQINNMNGGTVSSNMSSGNTQNGFYIDNFNGGSLIANTASGNDLDGFTVTTFSGGTIGGNTASGNLQHGFQMLAFNGGTLSDNVATGNMASGYEITGTGGTATGNTGSGNGSNDTYP